MATEDMAMKLASAGVGHTAQTVHTDSEFKEKCKNFRYNKEAVRGSGYASELPVCDRVQPLCTERGS